MSEFVVTIRSSREQDAYERLRAVLVRTLGLDWYGMAGEPDGSEVASDCAEGLWAAGFRLEGTR